MVEFSLARLAYHDAEAHAKQCKHDADEDKRGRVGGHLMKQPVAHVDLLRA